MQRDQFFSGVNEKKRSTVEQMGELGRSPLEAYTVRHLPGELRAVAEGRMGYDELARKQEALLRERAPYILDNRDPREAMITQMDLLFMLGGYLPSKQETKLSPNLLQRLIVNQCERFENLTPYMTYEMIVDVNCAEYERTGNMRTYTDGKIGQDERDFYYGHFVSEPYIKRAAYNMHELAVNATAKNKLPMLSSIAEDIKEFKLYMGQYSKLSKESFGYFRQYLAGYADGTRNASGAFMPSPQLLELALVAPTETYNTYLNESMPYFPNWAQHRIAELHGTSSEGYNVESQVAQGNLVLNSAEKGMLIQCVDEFINFRMAHLGITKNQIPEAFSSLDKLTRKDIQKINSERQILAPNVRGTAGFDVRNVLQNSVYRLTSLRERLTGSIGQTEEL